MGKVRQSSFELLRVFAILTILVSHTGLTISSQPLSSSATAVTTQTSPSLLTILLGFVANYGGSIGNSIFIIIAGYFASIKPSSPKRCIKLITPVFFYSIFYFVIGFIFKTGTVFDTNYNFIDIFHYFVTGGVWFVFSYTYLIILSYPIMIRWQILSNKFKIALLFIALLFIFIPNIPLWNLFYFMPAFAMLFSFFLGALIGSNINKLRETSTLKLTFFLIVSFVIILIIYYYITFMVTDGFMQINLKTRVVGQIIIPVAIVPLFLLIERLKIQNNFINLISSNCLAIYFFHQIDFSLTGVYLFNRTSAIDSNNHNIFLSLANSNLYLAIIYQIIACIFVFFIAIIVNEIRKYFSKKIGGFLNTFLFSKNH